MKAECRMRWNFMIHDHSLWFKSHNFTKWCLLEGWDLGLGQGWEEKLESGETSSSEQNEEMDISNYWCLILPYWALLKSVPAKALFIEENVKQKFEGLLGRPTLLLFAHCVAFFSFLWFISRLHCVYSSLCEEEGILSMLFGFCSAHCMNSNHRLDLRPDSSSTVTFNFYCYMVDSFNS